MASTLLSKTPLLNRLIHSSSSPSKKPQIFTSLFNKKLLHFQANPASVVHNPSRQLPRIMASSIAGARVHFSSQSLSTEDPVVSADWLHSNLKEPDLKVLDASWYMPDEQRNPIHEYQVAHIPGAIFFDIDGISDRTTKLPHMLPSEEAFAAVVSALGIENKDGVVVYDGKGIFSAARVWWMFRVFGHDRVWVLDGGLPKWRTLGYDVESSASGDAIFKATAASEAIERVYQGQYVGPITYQTEFQPHLVWNLDKVKENITERTHQHVDARSKARFDGDVPEPRKGIRSGHVPGSKCIPFAQEKWLHFQANPASVAYNSSRRLYLIMASSIVGARVRFSSNYLSAKDPVVSEDLLHSNPSENNLRFDGASSVPHNGIRSGHPAHHLPASIKWNEEGGEHANNLLLSLSNHPNPEVSCFSEKGFSQISKEIVGRTVHAICLKSLVGLSVFHTNTLINTYSKVGHINYARLVFDGMLKTNEASWNNMMSGYVRVCLYSEAMVFFQDICRLGIKPSGFVIASLVTACNKSSTMANEGFQLHGLAVKFGVIYDVFVGTSFVHFYGAYGIVSNAQKLFNEMPDRNVVSWTSLMVSYSDNGHKEEVINIYQRMRHEGIGCNENTIALVISSCGLLVDASLGLQLLGHATKFGLETKVSAANSLISMFGGCHNILEACNVFNQMNERDTISWNSIISANAQNGLYDESFRYFYWMRSAHKQINFTTLSILLSICGSVDYLKWGKGVHGLVVKYGLEFNICLCNTLLNMYSDSGRLEDAELIFGRMPEKDLISWNSMLACYARDGRCRCALKILAEMIWMKKEINYVTFTSALAACSDPEFLAEGIILHGLTIAMGLKDNLIIGNMLITLYGKSHKMVEAKKLFQRMPQRDKVTWNTLIGGYADNADLSEAVTAFNLMREGVRVDYITIVNILSACLTPDDVLKHGMAIHAHTVVTGLEVDQHVESSLITMYAKCGDVQSSSCIFDKLLFKSSSVWNAIITANAHHGFGEEALKLVARMRNAGIEFDQFSFSIALSVAADLAMLEEGQQLHGSAIKLGFNFDHFIVNAAMDMYGKCGDLDDALRILPQPIHRSRLSWNTLISTFAKHGHFQEARETFHEMLKLGVKPDHVSFVCLLSACSHGGLVDEGLSYYASMTSEYGIQPGIEHCVCIIDLLGRSGRLVQAELFIREMPMPPNDLVWRSLLASCRIYHNLDLGRKAAERLLELDPSDDSAYVLYSNMFATSGKWKDVENMRRQMGAINIQKKPAHSWVKLKGNVSTFGMGDQTHSQTEQINAKLAGLKKMVGEAGYVPDTSCSLQDTDEEQKEHNMWNHSERIALAYGLINTPEGTTVRIFKNLRVCGDCHSFFKYVSGNLGRKIILRDPYRFHHFTHGNCSCSDYW